MPISTPPDNPPADQPSNPAPAYPSLDQLAPNIPPVTWLWPGWIPRAMITLLCAAPGAGKSYFALDLARRLTAGLPWPDGKPSAAAAPEPSAVIYVDAEDVPQLLNARAVAWGMDRSHLYPMLPEPDGVIDLNDTPNGRACQARLTAMVAALRPALVIVDSLGSAGRGAENHVHVVEALFGYLNRLATRHQCALLLIHHLRKHGPLPGVQALDASLSGEDVRGSGHIVSLARSVLGLTEVRNSPPVQIALDPQANPPRRLQVVKTNLGSCPPPLGVTFTPASDGGALLEYGPVAEPVRRYTAVESCARWLYELLTLADGPLAPRDVERYAVSECYSRSTVHRARELPGSQVIDTAGRHWSNNYWTLPPWPRPNPPAALDPKPAKPRRSARS